MAQQTFFALTPREEGIIYFIAAILLYLASYSPPIGSPTVVRTIFGFLAAATIAVKFELQQLSPPKIAPKTQALFSFVALLLAGLGGQISALYSGYWYAGLIVAIIGAILAAWKDITG